MNQREIDTLEKCIAQMKTGVPIEECINHSIDLSPEMIEILKTTTDLMCLGENKASDELMKRSLTKLLSQAQRLNAEANQATPKRNPTTLGVKIREFLHGRGSFRPLISQMALVFGITALLILLSGGLVITSAKSLPGDSLYPIKLAVEDITVYLVPSSEIRQEYEVNYSQQRVAEVNRLIVLNRKQQISFEGVLEEKSLSNWIVSGIPITIQATTTFVGELKGTEPFVTGSVVEVEGITNSQGGVTANEIHLRQYQFIGTVEKINKNSWQISGTTLSITPHTQIEAGIEVGDEVSVLIRSQDDGLYALSIQSAGTPTTMQPMEPTESINLIVVDDPVEHRDIDTHKAISTNELEHYIENDATSPEDVLAADYSGEGERDGSSTVEPTENHETENHEYEVSTTPEQPETPEPTQSHEGTP